MVCSAELTAGFDMEPSEAGKALLPLLALLLAVLLHVLLRKLGSSSPRRKATLVPGEKARLTYPRACASFHAVCRWSLR